jgi:hypothetical protein
MGTVMAVLTVGYCLLLAQYSNFLVLVGRGQHRIFGILTALTSLVCVTASVVSVRVLHWGLPGIAWSNLLPMALLSGILLPIYFNRKMRITTAESIHHVWYPALSGSLPAVIMITAWKLLAPPDRWLEILGVVISAMALTLLSSWFLSLKKIERERFAHIALGREM